MPIQIKKIESTKKATLGEIVEVRDYWFSGDMEPIGVLYGCFSPFTGRYGHARMIEEGKKQGINKFIILFPNKKAVLDSDRNMFTLEQKLSIANAGAKDLGYDILEAFIGTENFFLSELLALAERYENNRIVMICGNDRYKEYKKFMNDYDKNRVQLPVDDNSIGKFELIGLHSRGTRNVSGTAVREAIRNNDKESFLEMTDYSEKMWDMVREYVIKNGVITEMFLKNTPDSFMDFYKTKNLVRKMLRENGSTKRVGIKHLYNPKNPMQIKPLEFIDLLSVIKKSGSVLENGVNFEITEKIDGAGFRMGIDENGFYIEQSYSGRIYDTAFLADKYTTETGGMKRLGSGWIHAFETLQRSRKLQTVLRDIYEKHGSFKVVGEILINKLGLSRQRGVMKFSGINYLTKNLGKDLTIVVFDIIDDSGSGIPNKESLIKTLIKDASTQSVKFDDVSINSEQKIVLNLRGAVQEAEEIISILGDALESQGLGTIESILSNKSRKRDALELRRYVSSEVERAQFVINKKIEEELGDFKGKWGNEYEGVVIKFSDGSLVKITSETFKEHMRTKDEELQNWIMGEI